MFHLLDTSKTSSDFAVKARLSIKPRPETSLSALNSVSSITVITQQGTDSRSIRILVEFMHGIWEAGFPVEVFVELNFFLVEVITSKETDFLVSTKFLCRFL